MESGGGGAEEEEEEDQNVAEIFRQEFRTTGPQPGETQVAFLYRLKRLLGRWLEAAQVEVSPSLEDVMVTEQFCQTLAPPAAALVRARKPASLDDLARLVDQMAAAAAPPGQEGGNPPDTSAAPRAPPPPPPTPRDRRQGGQAAATAGGGGGGGTPAAPAPSSAAAASSSSGGRHVRCHQCRRLGHVRRDCPEREPRGKEARARKKLPSIN